VEITEVRIKLMDEPGERLKAFCSITLDNCFVVRDLKIIEGSSGPFVAMPSRKLTAHCSRCGIKNHLRSNFCNQCGAPVSGERMPVDSDGRAKLYADIAHPINSVCREMIQEGVISEYYDELQRSKEPDYISRYDDFESDYNENRNRETTAKAGDARIDQAHGQAGAHVGRSGNGSSDVTTAEVESETAAKKYHVPVSSDNICSQASAGGGTDFGSGIFSE
jgi:stage V sporulation protein G